MGSSCSMHADVKLMLVRKCKKEKRFQQPARFGSEIRCWMSVHGSTAQVPRTAQIYGSIRNTEFSTNTRQALYV